MFMNQFIALDFETANGNPASICSVGMVKVIDNMMTETFYTTVNPETYFSESNIRVHGIHPEDVTDAPTFKTVYPYMLDFIGDLPIVAHNAQFDMRVLHASINRYHFEMPTLPYFCSVIMARDTVQNHSHSLKNMMKYYNIDFHGHHHALNDAKACAMITVRLLKHYDNLDDYLRLKRRKKYIKNISTTSKKQSMSRYQQELSSIVPEQDKIDTSHPFYNKRIAITGTLHKARKHIVQYIVNCGGTYTDDIDNIDYFIMGKQKNAQPSKKEGIVRNKIALGQDIIIMNDDKLQAMIAFYQ
ncbi:exonuclease domain-containing protein [Macrococcus sp. TMW 2.2395]|nr:exonuclease domain-containing protein [Macrococcus sp. TMW 2.2395]MCU7557798.1 exonuclease domain-containing protein [Macrococcus sp. TMW 2.2395]